MQLIIEFNPVFLAFWTPKLKFFEKNNVLSPGEERGFPQSCFELSYNKNESLIYLQKKEDKNCFLDSFTLSNRNQKRKLCQSPSKIY